MTLKELLLSYLQIKKLKDYPGCFQDETSKTVYNPVVILLHSIKDELKKLNYDGKPVIIDNQIVYFDFIIGDFISIEKREL